MKTEAKSYIISKTNDTLNQLMANDPQHQQLVNTYVESIKHLASASNVNIREHVEALLDESINVGNDLVLKTKADLVLKLKIKELFNQLFNTTPTIHPAISVHAVYPYQGDVVDYEECLKHFKQYIEQYWLYNRTNKLPTYFQAGTQSAKTGYAFAETLCAFETGTDIVVLITKNDLGAATMMAGRSKKYSHFEFQNKILVVGKEETASAQIHPQMLFVAIQNENSINAVYDRIKEHNKHCVVANKRGSMVHVIIDEVDECNARNATDKENRINAIRAEAAIMRIVDDFDATYSGYTATMLQEAILYSQIDHPSGVVDLIPSQVHYLPCHHNYQSYMKWNLMSDGTVVPLPNASFFDDLEQVANDNNIEYDLSDNVSFSKISVKWQLDNYNRSKKQCPDIVTIVRDPKRDAHKDLCVELAKVYRNEGYKSFVLEHVEGGAPIPLDTQVVIVPYNGKLKGKKYNELLCSKIIERCYQTINPADRLVSIVFVGDNMQNRTITFEKAFENLYKPTDYYYGAYCNLTILGTKSSKTNIARLAQEIRCTGVRPDIKEHKCLTTVDISTAIISYTTQQMALHNAIKIGQRDKIEIASNRPIAKARIDRVLSKSKAGKGGKMTIKDDISYADRMGSLTNYSQHDYFLPIPRGQSGDWLDVEWANSANAAKFNYDMKRVFCDLVEAYVNSKVAPKDAIDTTMHKWRPVSHAYANTSEYFASDSKWNISGGLGWSTPTNDYLAKLFPSGDGALFFFTDVNGDRWLYVKHPTAVIVDGSDFAVYTSASDNFLVNGVLPAPSQWVSKFVHKYPVGTELVVYYR